MPPIIMSQFDFINSIIHPGLSVIEASAGTGKTFAISHLVPRLLLEKSVSHIGDILLVTFTNDAARELSDRVRRVLEKFAANETPEEEENEPGVFKLREAFKSSKDKTTIRQALIDIDQLSVSTIHSFCQRTLQTEGTLCGIPAPLELITDLESLIEEAVYQIWQEKIVVDNELGAKAAKDGWKITNDVEFIKKALAMEDFAVMPPVKPEEILKASQAIDETGLSELDTFFKRPIRWVNAGKEEQRVPFLDAIKMAQVRGYCDTPTMTDEPFWKAINWLSKLEDYIGATNKDVEVLKAEAASLTVVKLAKILHDKREPFKSHKKELILWYWQNECLALVRGKIESALKNNRQITQDGLILALRDALRNPTSGPILAQRLRDRYKVALIDESQDTDPKQFEIFNRLFIGSEKHRLVLIGDPKQAIYGFRGADVNTYLTARNGTNAVFRLNETYRSPASLVNAVNAFFVRDHALLKEGLEFIPAVSKKIEGSTLIVDGLKYESPLEAWIVPDDNHAGYVTPIERQKTISDTVASKIVFLLEKGKKMKGDALDALLPSDFAVLTHSKKQAEAMADALKSRGVPAVLSTDADVLESDEAWELLLILKAILDSRRSPLRYAALSTRLLGMNAQEIRDLRSGRSNRDEYYLDQLIGWSQIWEKEGFAKVLDLIDREFSIIKRLAASEFGERRVTNFRQLIDLIQSAGHEHSNRPEHLLRWLSQEIKKAGENVAPEERLLRLENDGKAVQVLTMHKAKGLEFDFVFCPYLWDMGHDRDKFPKLPKSGPDEKEKLICKGLASEDIKLKLKQNQMEDRLRLTYVAMTRAKIRLWIYGGRMGGDGPRSALLSSPIDWLLRESQQAEGEASERLSLFNENWNPDTAKRGSRHSAGIKELNTFIYQTAPPTITFNCRKLKMAENLPDLKVLDLPDLPRYWRVTSFSALTRETHRHGSIDLSPEVKVEDELQTEDAGNIVPSEEVVLTVLNAFAAAPGSPLIGSAIHEWLEQWDFGGSKKTAPTEEQLKVHLEKYPLLKQRVASDPEDKKGIEVAGLVEMLSHLAGAILPELGCTIAEGCPSPKASEWNFHMKIIKEISPKKLSKAFENFQDPRFPDYAEDLSELTTSSIHGYLQGYMDRLVFHNNRYGVIDWKSNKLGKMLGSYSEKSMIRCAVENHYILQTHLYLVALRRFLKLSGKQASPMAGAWLVFLRAVHSGSTSGILPIHPAPELLDCLDELFFQLTP